MHILKCIIVIYEDIYIHINKHIFTELIGIDKNKKENFNLSIQV